LAAARREVLLGARELLAASIKQGREDVALCFLIADQSGQVLDTIYMTEVLPKSLLSVKGQKR